MRRKPFRIQPYLFALPALLFFALFVAYPIVANFANSFYRFSAISYGKEPVGAANFGALATDGVFWRALWNNVIFAVLSVAIQVGLGLVLAAILQRGMKAGRKVFRSIFFLPMVMSVVSVGLLWTLIYDPVIGLFNQIVPLLGLRPRGWLGEPGTAVWAVVVTACWQYTGFNMVMLLAGMQAIPEELYEAAIIDGTTERQNFFHITVPYIKELVSIVILITVIGSFKVFDYVWVMTRGGPNHASEVLTTYIYLLAFTTDQMGYGSAVASILFVIAFCFSVLRLRMMREEWQEG
jgi:raffinose/stachyose/melibiose transport system permease protein